MTKWYALALIAIGLGLYALAKPPGEFGLPLYAILGLLLSAIGIVLIGVLIFIHLG